MRKGPALSVDIRASLAAAIFAIALFPGAAFGHAEEVSTDPEAGSRLKEAPHHLVINVSETPVEDATSVEVTDGCDRVVATDLFTEEKTIHVNLSEVGRPGRWKVVYDTLSAEDGHTSGGDFTFRVAGKKNCSEPAASPAPSPEPTSGAEPGDQAGPDDGGDDESGFPVVPVAAAAIAIAGVALLARGSAKG